MEDRKVVRGRRLSVMQEVIDGPPPRCTKCEEVEAKHKEDSEKFFKEIEHLRRGMHKLVDAGRAFMPPSTLRALQESLQLDVRYFTTPAAGEGGPLPPLPVQEDQSALIEKLRARIAEQDDKMDEQERLITELERELKKALDALRAAGVQVPSAPIKRQRKEGPKSVEIQTDPWAPPRPQDHGVFDAGSDSDDPVTGKKKVKKGPADEKEKRARGPRGDGPEDDPRQVSAAPGQQAVQKVFQRGGGEGETTVVHTGADPEELRRLQAELELLKMKLAAAERQLKEIDALKAEIEELKRLLAAKEAELAALRAQVAKLQALLESRGGGGKNDEASAAKQKKQAEDTEKKKKKKASGAVETTGGKKGTVLKPDEEKPEKRKLVTDDGEVEAEGEEEEESEDEDSESEEEKVMVDVCVGNGPGKGLQDEPIRARGRGMFKEEDPMNKTGKVYDRQLTSQPALGLTNTVDFTASTPPEGMARSLPSRGHVKSRGLGAGVYSGGSVVGGVQFATSWSSKSTGNLFNPASTWAEAEPYLEQVWETNPKGHRMPVKRELVKLGALTPQQKQADPMARTLPSLSTSASPDSSPKSSWPAQQRPPRTAAGALERSKAGFTLKEAAFTAPA